ncbi:PAS domain-containing protein [Zooshikella harenae]|nr:PAS domain-containing protein [Zooshikella harenae]
MITAELMERLVNASNDGVVVAEREGDESILIYVNPAFQRLTGYTADEILYKDCRFLQGNDRQQEGIEKVRDAIRNNHSTCQVLRNYRKDGSMFWNELRLTPVFDNEEQLQYYIGIQRDVTAEVEAKQRLQQVKHDLDLSLELLAAYQSKFGAL